jgi:Ca2+-binding EF-hand superfamily protein
MEGDLKKLHLDDLKLLYETFSVIRSGDYEGS